VVGGFVVSKLGRKLILTGTTLLVALGLVVGGSLPANAATYSTIKLSRVGSSPTVAGEFVSFSGTTPTVLRGKTITLQRMDPGQSRWVSVGTGKATQKGSFALRGKAAGMGKNQWRAVYSGTNTYKSPTLSTKVSKWLYLDDLEEVDGFGFNAIESVGVGATTYTRGLVTYLNSSRYETEYNLSYKCTSLIAGVGLSNTSRTGSKAKLSVGLDGVDVTLAAAQGVGTGKAVKLDVTGTFRLALKFNPIVGSSAAVFGNARVLCSGMP
jgi:hypothetical protein